MRLVWPLVLSLIAAGPEGISDDVFSDRLPPEIPDHSRWESFKGEFVGREMVVAYQLYVNPARGAVYEIARYRVRPRSRNAAAPQGPWQTEKLIWNARSRQPLRCFERVTASEPETLDQDWREMAPGSGDYRALMFVVMQVYALPGRAPID